MGKKIHDLLVLGKSFDCTKNKCATTLGVENFNRFVTQNIDGSLFGELKQTLA